MKLMREVRVFPAGENVAVGGANSWGGSPGKNGLGAFWVLHAIVQGPIDDKTGFVCNIADLDRLLRQVAAGTLAQRVPPTDLSSVSATRALVDVFPTAAARCPFGALLESLEWRISPYLALGVDRKYSGMVRVTQSFEFSASHRLYCPTMSEEENLRVFGKCANAHGHGHNYVVEITVSGIPDERTGSVADFPWIQRVVKEHVIDRFDHKHLNLDCAEFADLNPSVENITRVIWDRLHDAFGECCLSLVRVWETPKTYAEYDGGESTSENDSARQAGVKPDCCSSAEKRHLDR